MVSIRAQKPQEGRKFSPGAGAKDVQNSPFPPNEPLY